MGQPQHGIGVATDGRCRRGKAEDTLWHRLGVCESTREWRMEHGKGDMFGQGVARLWDPLYSRGGPARPRAPTIRQNETWFERLVEGAEFAAECLVYTGGSATDWYL